MEADKKEFIEFMVDSNVLKFGEFTLKSGRKSPFFMNAGSYVTGTQLRKLGEYYAKAIHDAYGTDFDVLFGPAYKGIPLTVATTMAFSELYGKDVKYCSNRKEVKDHGDTGILLGSPIKDGDKVVIIEDLISTGMSSLAAKNALVNAGADIKGMVAIFSYNFNKARKAFEDDNVELTTLSNYDTLVEVAHETGYIKESDIEVLKEWRVSPSTWGQQE